MKKVIKAAASTFQKVILLITGKCFLISSNKFFFSKFSINSVEAVRIKNSIVENTLLFEQGNNNSIIIDNARVVKSKIQISGNNNKLHVSSRVVLRNMDIQIRGNNCSIIIGKASTFGGARIINVGDSNSISIGKGCLFADNIEIWASDTHNIYDQNNNIINKEKPILIEDKVWVGSHAKILKGVTIKENAVVGMGTIVTKDISAGTISVGFPNKEIRDNVTWKLEYGL